VGRESKKARRIENKGKRFRESDFQASRGERLVTKAVHKIALSPSHDIPSDKLILRQSFVRGIKVDVSVEELAEDIDRHGLSQALNVRPVLQKDGTETSKFKIPTGGRQFRALSLLVKQKHLQRQPPSAASCRVRGPRSWSRMIPLEKTCSALPCIRLTCLALC